ncbi:hypothetical protein vseg_012669 [Gypsophila vaccaria]
MECLVNKKVRLRNCLTKTTLVAFMDKESVTHSNLKNYPKQDNAVWVIKSKHPYKSVQFQSNYGTLLVGIGKYSEGLVVFQIDKSMSRDDTDEYQRWWKITEVNKSGLFNCVQISLSYACYDFCLYPDYEGSKVNVLRRDSKLSFDTRLNWEIEIVEKDVIDQGKFIVSKPEHDRRAKLERVIDNLGKVKT